MFRVIGITFIFFAAATISFAQSGISLLGAQQDTSLPVEVTADNLSFDQAAESAVFSGNAIATQGEVTLAADTLNVMYSQETGQIVQLVGEGDVQYTNGVETASAQTANYDAETRELTLLGSAVLRQRQTMISANQIIIDTQTNAAQLRGNVRTRFIPQN
ncbi:MAG: lipopolysaccharide transport periplasmic protein LptA [Pseudomonadota bacterium]